MTLLHTITATSTSPVIFIAIQTALKYTASEQEHEYV